MSSDHLLAPPRPASNLSYSRPVSRASQRSARFSHYSAARQARIAPCLKTLVRQVTGLDEEYNPDDFQNALAVAVKHIDRLTQFSPSDASRVDAQINGHVEKAYINVQNALADAFRKTYAKLKESQHPSLSAAEISTTVSAFVEFLLHLSSPPDASTLAYAACIPQKNDFEQSRPKFTWEEILKEEPFEGQHWQGAYGLPPGSTVETWESESSDVDLSSGKSDDYEFGSTSDTPFKDSGEGDQPSALYWNENSSQSSCDSHFDFNRPWTLGPTSDELLEDSFTLNKDTTYIKELDVIREVLFLLQGLPSILFKTDVDIIKVQTHRRITHLTHTAQISILNLFASLSTVMKPLRTFEIISKFGRSPTFQAFMSGVAHQLLQFDIWCSSLETHLIPNITSCEGTTIEVISLLQLQYQVQARTSHIFQDLLNIMRTWESRSPTARFPCQIINMLWQCLKERQMLQDEVTAQALWQVLRTTVEPLWLNLRRWLKDGIPIDLGLEEGESKLTPTWNVAELFIRINPLIDAAAPDFWEAKYTLKRNPVHAEGAESPVPLFLLDIAQDILAAGKAVGLVRAMGLYHSLEWDWIQSWNTFETMTSGIPTEDVDSCLKERISEILTPPCQLAQATLSRVLVYEGQLWKHIQNMEGICLMTNGNLMDQFAEQLFSKMDSSRFVWHDYHFMNAAFRDIAKMDQLVNASLVTFNYKPTRDRKRDRTIEAMEGLTVEYAVPFPLIYLFGSESSMSYSQLFCFVLQIRRAKFVLDQISLNTVNAQFSNSRFFLMTFYLIKWRLSWFINTLSSFIKMHVIDVAVRDLRKALSAANSLDEMINLHQAHLVRLLDQLFLRENTCTLHQTILSILDLSLRLNDCLTTHKAGNSDFIRSSHPFKSPLSRRPFRRHRKKLDVIGFVDTLPAASTDEDESEEDESNSKEADFEDSELITSDSSIPEQLEYISAGMERLIHGVKREVQILASGVTDDADIFGILLFLLEAET